VPSNLILPFIFISKFLANLNVAHFNNNYQKTMLEIYWEVRGEKSAMLKHRKILSRVWQILLGHEHMLFSVISTAVTWKPLAMALTSASLGECTGV